MTDNIQKLYEIAGVEKKPVYSGSQLYNPVITGYEYPPFTAEKQLELIKWIAMDLKQDGILHIDRWTSGKVRFGFDIQKYVEPYYELDYAGTGKDFEQALADLVLSLWQDLTNDQKQEIKRILQ